ncbi:hypothetical protein BGZ65_001396 [Modicella reniformis]|uniref:Uncharacterized protein n=1 Tax=Modicella reniformis TaxID=1440133 RepID=A0A9P6LTZ7_9FUNG|nr:hypothetical protein BGZ65_001396 [Modicella reniformis]
MGIAQYNWPFAAVHPTNKALVQLLIDTSFKQQRLKAWQPILTAKSVLPTFFILGILFAPLGGLLVWKNGQVTEMSFDYTNCKSALTTTPVPESTFVHSSAVGDFNKPTYMIGPIQDRLVYAVTGSAEHKYPVQVCDITLTIPVDLQPPVMMYYKLTNFYQNHRKYTKSLDHKQLKGEASDIQQIQSRKGCIMRDELIYPCGLIANSMFNAVTGAEAGGANYTFQYTGIAWSSDRGKYQKNGYSDLSKILPPVNWRARYPLGLYSNDFPPPDFAADEHFQVWMRTAGWPTFLKAYGRNDNDVLKAGQYQMKIDMNFPIDSYGGKKYIVITTIGAIGGRNNFLGIGYIVLAVLCASLGIIFTAFHIIKPRIIGDHSKISFGGEATAHTRSSGRADDAGGSRIRSRYEDD